MNLDIFWELLSGKVSLSSRVWRVFWKGIQLSRNTLVIFLTSFVAASGFTSHYATVPHVLHFWLFQTNSTISVLTLWINRYSVEERKKLQDSCSLMAATGHALYVFIWKTTTTNLFEGGGIQAPQLWSSGENAFFLCRLKGTSRNTFRVGACVVCWTAWLLEVPLSPGTKGSFD